ncbi:ATP-binding protein [bacterium]|nr:ATP-binding protein [bacterium]
MLNGAVSGAVQSLQAAVDAKQIQITQTIPLNLGVAMSPVVLQQLLTSVLDNAIKFSNARGIVEVHAESRRSRAIITISDTGVGIQRDKLNQLMAPFSRATDVMRFDYEGMGPSLYLDKVIMEQVGGTFTIDSEPEKGTTVTLELPTS